MDKPVLVQKLKNNLKGPVVAMTTTFNKDLSLDIAGIKALTDFYIENGIKNVIAAGSTGEFFSLSDEERKIVIKTVAEQSDGKMIVIGCSAHSGTKATIELAKYCEDVGCDGTMVTPPYYSFSGFAGIKKHYQMVSDAINIGIVIYFSNSVLRFPLIQKIVNESIDCLEIKELASIPKVSAIKDASGNYDWHRDIAMKIDGLAGLATIIGSKGMGYHLWGHNFGSKAFITGLGNIWPKIELDFYNKLEAGKVKEALQIVKEKELEYLEVGRNTDKYWACVKYLLSEEGLSSTYMRSPLLELDDAEKKKVRDTALRLGLLK